MSCAVTLNAMFAERKMKFISNLIDPWLGQIYTKPKQSKGFPGSSDSKESACSAEDSVWIPAEDLLERGMSTPSSIPTCRIPGTKELDRVAKYRT